MNVLGWIFVVPLVAILAAGALAFMRASRSATPAGSPVAVARTRRTFVDRMQVGFGRFSGAILILAAGTGVALAICWPVGYAARRFDGQDHKIYNWVLPRADIHWLTSSMKLLTKMGNNRETQVVGGIFMVVLTLLWLLRRRDLTVLVPAVLIIAAYEIEHQLQHTLKLLAHRGHPPAGLGTYPSGGCARLICIYGIIIYLVLRHFRATRGRYAVLAWTALTAAAWIEGYSRLYLSKHWFSDVIGGWIFGVILLLMLIAAAQMLDRPRAEAVDGTSGSGAPEHAMPGRDEPAGSEHALSGSLGG